MDERLRRFDILVVRAWREDESERPLRARLVEVKARPREDRTLCVAATVDEACDTLRAWLLEVLER